MLKFFLVHQMHTVHHSFEQRLDLEKVQQRSLGSGSGKDCSLFAFDWERERKFFSTFKWSTQSPKSSKFLAEILEEVGSLGNATSLRPKFGSIGCDLKKVQWVDCNLLYFPRSEHRCQARF